MYTIRTGDLEGMMQLDNARMIMWTKMLHNLLLMVYHIRDLSAQDLQSVVTAIFAGANKPDGREATGSQLVNHGVLGNRVTDVDRMEAAGHVFLNIFALGHIHVVQRAVPHLAVPTCSLG